MNLEILLQELLTEQRRLIYPSASSTGSEELPYNTSGGSVTNPIRPTSGSNPPRGGGE